MPVITDMHGEERVVKVNHIGRKLGDFTVKALASHKKEKHQLWLCECDTCGSKVYFGYRRMENPNPKYRCKHCAINKNTEPAQAEAKIETEVTAPEEVVYVLQDKVDPYERFIELMTAIEHLATEAASLDAAMMRRKRETTCNKTTLAAVARVFQQADQLMNSVEEGANARSTEL